MTNAKVKLLLVVLVVGLLGLLIMLDAKRREAESALKQLTVRLEQLQGGNTQQNQTVAKEVVVKLRKHMDIPSDVDPTVAQIVDVQKLRAQNAFYNKAENGDYLIVTPTRAILYSPKKDVVLDVIPVQIAPQTSSAAATASSAPAKK